MTAEFIAVPDLAVPNGFFTRNGGVSTGPFASLNCSLSGQDARDHVLENRARVARALGADPAALVGLTQVHGADTVTVTHAWPPGAGPRADACVTNQPGIALGIGQGIVTGHDTLADDARFFSHRRRTLANAGPIGHQISVIRL